MRKNSLAILILVLGGFGCRQPAQQRVYVDFEAVLASYKSSPLPSRPVPKAPNGLPAQTLSLPAVAPRRVIVEGAPTVQAGALLEENRKKAVQELTRLLSRRYQREAERAGEKLVRALDPKRKAAYLAAQNSVQQEFQTYAVQRAPLIARLTSLVGFPDPNPNSVPPPADTPAFLVARLKEADDIRKQIAQMDAAYENKIQDLLAQAGNQYNVDLAAIQKQVDQDRQVAMRRAESEAVAEAAKTYKSLRPILMGPSQVDLPGEAAQSLQLPAVPPPISAPEVRERTLNANERRAILRSQLNIWLKLNGYDLAKSPDGVKDMTAQFEQWRKDRKL